MIEGSGSGSIHLNDLSGSGSRRPKNIRIRICNTGFFKFKISYIGIYYCALFLLWVTGRDLYGFKPDHQFRSLIQSARFYVLYLFCRFSVNRLSFWALTSPIRRQGTPRSPALPLWSAARMPIQPGKGFSLASSQNRILSLVSSQYAHPAR